MLDVKDIDGEIDQIDRGEMNIVHFHEPEIVRGVRDLMMLTTGLACIAVILIISSVYSMRRENQARQALLNDLAQSQIEATAASRSATRCAHPLTASSAFPTFCGI